MTKDEMNERAGYGLRSLNFGWWTSAQTEYTWMECIIGYDRYASGRVAESVMDNIGRALLCDGLNHNRVY